MPKKKSVPKPPLNPPKPPSDYLIAGFISLGVVALSAVYLTTRSGTIDPVAINKTLADASLILLGLILIIGTGSRLFSWPDKFIPYRKEVGIMAFILALAHYIASLFFVPGRYNYTTLLDLSNRPAMFGTASLIILFLLFLSSRQKITAILGPKLWWKFQYWGLRASFLLAGIHVILLKSPRWLAWYQAGTTQKVAQPGWPTLDLLVGWFIAAVILIRISEIGGPKVAKFVWYLTWTALLLIYAATFWWGTRLVN